MIRPSLAVPLAWALLAPLPLIAQDHADRIARIEASLAPALRVEGRPAPTFTLGDRMEHWGVPGVSVAVIDGGELAWARAYGVKDAGTGEPVTTETLFQAASISKPVTAVAVLRLVEQGRLDLDEDVNAYLESWKVPVHDFPEARITLRRLLTHTAGTTVHGFPGYRRSAERPTTAGVLRGEGNTAAVIVDLEPGSEWRYSGGGTTVVQQVLEDVTGRAFPEVMAELVLGPANMTSSTYEQPLPEDRWGDAASGHRPDGSPVPEGWHVYPEMAAAGLWTTPTDLMRLALEVQRSLQGGSDRLLGRATAVEMLTPVMNGYGIGFGTGEGPDARFGHGGSNAGFRATVTAFHEGGRGAAIMTNGDRGGALAQELLLAIAEAYGWEGVEPRTIALLELAAERRASLEGTWRVPAMGGMEITITATDDGLFRLERPGAPPSTLVPTEGDRLIDLADGTVVVIEWEGGRAVKLRTQGVEILPAG